MKTRVRIIRIRARIRVRTRITVGFRIRVRITMKIRAGLEVEFGLGLDLRLGLLKGSGVQDVSHTLLPVLFRPELWFVRLLRRNSFL